LKQINFITGGPGQLPPLPSLNPALAWGIVLPFPPSLRPWPLLKERVRPNMYFVYSHMKRLNL